MYVPPEHQAMWVELEALAAEQNRPVAHLVNQALAEFTVLSAYRIGKAHSAKVMAANSA